MVKVNKHKLTRLDERYLIQSKTPYPNYKQTIHEYPCTCGCFVTLYDKHHDETFCLKCGKVRQEHITNNLIYGQNSTTQLYDGSGYTHSERQYFKSRHKKPPTHINTKDLQRTDYKFTLDIFKTELCLSCIDIQNIWLIIEKVGGIKKLASGVPYEQVLLALCRFILIQKNITGYLINFNTLIYKEYGLTRKKYNQIANNIEKYMRLKTWNT